LTPERDAKKMGMGGDSVGGAEAGDKWQLYKQQLNILPALFSCLVSCRQPSPMAIGHKSSPSHSLFVFFIRKWVLTRSLAACTQIHKTHDAATGL